MSLKDLFSSKHDNSDLHAKDSEIEVREDEILPDNSNSNDPYYGILEIYSVKGSEIFFIEHLGYNIEDSGVLDIELPEIEGDDEPHFVISANYIFKQVSKKEFERLKLEEREINSEFKEVKL